MKIAAFAAACLTLAALAPLPAAADSLDVYIAGPGMSIAIGEPPPRWDRPAYARPGHVWIPGRWASDGYRYFWIAGSWAPVRPTFGYGPQRWEPRWEEHREARREWHRERPWGSGREWRGDGDRHHRHDH